MGLSSHRVRLSPCGLKLAAPLVYTDASFALRKVRKKVSAARASCLQASLAASASSFLILPMASFAAPTAPSPVNII